MLLPSLLSASVLGVIAQAFLLPENVNLPPAHGSNDVLPTTVDSAGQVISLDCSTCPYALQSERNGVHEWTADVASDLKVKIETDGKSLTFNDVPFYPITNPTLPPVLSVSQTKKNGDISTMEGFHGDLRLSYSVEYDEKKFEDNSLVTVLVTVMGLDGQMVKIDDVEIKVIKKADGTLQLHSVNTVPASASAPDAKCETILCRVFAKIMTGMNRAKATAKAGAHKMKCFCVKGLHKITGHKFHKGGKHAHPHNKGGDRHHGGMPHRRPDGTVELPSHIHFKPAGSHKHHHHHHKGFIGQMGRIVKQTVKVFFVPLLIGVAFGLAASVVGMLVGQTIVYLWIKFRSTKREPVYERLNTNEKDAPPAYQDAQAVEVMTEKEVDAKA